jgi:hypothetical protein
MFVFPDIGGKADLIPAGFRSGGSAGGFWCRAVG